MTMLKTTGLTAAENISLSKEIALVAALDTPLTTLLLANGRTEKATGVIHTWRERTLDGTANITVAEGSKDQNIVSSVRAELNNVCEILLKTAEVSGSVMATGGIATPDILSSEIADRLAETKIGLEKKIITGVKDDGSVSGVRAMAGLTSFIDPANVVIGAATLTEAHIKGLAKALWAQGANGQIYCLLNSDLKEAVDALFADKYSYVHKTNDFGLVVSTYNTNYGAVNFILDRFAPVDQLIAFDLNALSIAFLREPQAQMLGQQGDALRAQVLTEACLKVASKKCVASWTKTA